MHRESADLCTFRLLFFFLLLALLSWWLIFIFLGHDEDLVGFFVESELGVGLNLFLLNGFTAFEVDPCLLGEHAVDPAEWGFLHFDAFVTETPLLPSEHSRHLTIRRQVQICLSLILV